MRIAKGAEILQSTDPILDIFTNIEKKKKSKQYKKTPRFYKQLLSQYCQIAGFSFYAEYLVMRYLDQEAVLQGWAGLTLLDGLGGEK